MSNTTKVPALAWIENSPTAPSFKINDYVLICIGTTRRISGFVVEKELGWFRMYNGPVAPESSVVKFIDRKGEPFTKGTHALPCDHF